MPTSAQLLCPDRTNNSRKLQDQRNNLAEAATCRFSEGEHPNKTCVLINSPNAYHPNPMPVTRSQCLYCTQMVDLPRGPFSHAAGRNVVKRWWKAWSERSKNAWIKQSRCERS